MVRLEPRENSTSFWVYGSPLLAIGLTLVSGAFIFLIMGLPVVETLGLFFITPLSSISGLTELAIKATPLILIAIGLAFGFQAGVWNIGAEGQFLIGGVAGGATALAFYGTTGAHILPLTLVAGILGGIAWAAIPAFLKTKLNTNEILTSLMLVYVAGLLLSFLVHGPLRDPDGFNFPESRLFEDTARLPTLIPYTRMHAGIVLALLVTSIAWYLYAKHIIGLQVRVLGQAPKAARFAGINVKKLTWFIFIISGGLAGFAGTIEVNSTIGQLVPGISIGYGFTAIIVAFVGRLHPAGIVLAGLVLSLTYLGGESVQINAGLPQAITGVFQGMLLFYLLACDVLIQYRVRLTPLQNRAIK